jgi:type IV pilus assembly protein PilA
VVAIIAILAAIAISPYQDYVIRSQVSVGSSLADGVKTAVGEFVNNYGRYPNASTGNGANVSLGLAVPASISGTYVASVGTSSGVIVAHYDKDTPFKANTAIENLSLLFSPVTHAGSISWVCKKGQTGLKDKWLPASCR